MPRQVGIVCYICGREFGTRSIGIHEPQCLKKWENVNNKLPKKKRQPPPVKPVEFDQSFSNDPKKRAEQIEAINLASNAAATENLAPCKNCGRSFLPTRIESHEKICCNLKMSPGKRLQSNSGYYGQRIVVVDGEQVDVTGLKKENTFSTSTLTRNKDTHDYNTTNILSKVESQINQNIKKGPLLTLPCQFCKKPISHNAINIHIKKCKARSDPLPQTSEIPKVNCPFCNKEFPHTAITVHTKNCSSKPKQLGQIPVPVKKPSPPQKQGSRNKINAMKLKPMTAPPMNMTPPQVDSPPIRRQWDANPQEAPNPYQRYNNSRPNSGSSSNLAASFDAKILLNSSLEDEVVVDLVLGVDPSLVLNCMVCGLIVLKSKLNTHYHNYCQKSNITRSLTIPPSTKLPKPPSSPHPQLITCQICNRNFKDTVIEQHESECSLKNQCQLNGNEQLAHIYEKHAPVPNMGTTALNRLASPTVTDDGTQVVGKVVTGKFVPCINCGKQFTVRSLVIHQKQCMT